MSEQIPETPEPEAPAPPEEPPEAAWAGPSRDEWEQTQAQLSEYAALVQQQQPQQQEQEQLRPPDPWAEDYPQQLEAYVDAKLAFVQQLQQQMEMQEGHQAAMDSFEKLASQGGQFDKEMAWTVAREIVAQSGRPPTSERESQEILAKAASQVREYEKRIGEAYHQQQLEQMQTIAGGQRRLPAAGQQGAQTVPAGGYGNVPHAVEDRFFGGN